MSGSIVIVGGGLAGSAAAITLARAGRDVTLLEREREPAHKVCGEFLSTEALDELTHLGLNARSLGAVPIRSVRVATSSTRAASAALPFPAMSLTRRCLDDALLTHAAAHGVEVRRGCTAQSIAHDAHGWHILTGEGVLDAPSLLLATGKHDLRGRPRTPGVQSKLVAFKMYFALAPQQAAALAEHVELVLYPGGYGGLQPVENNVANLCCLIARKRLQELGGWHRTLAHITASCPHLRDRLQHAKPLLTKPLAISSIPYGFLRKHTSEGLWNLGDQAAVIPSFTGDGMSIALYSGRLAADMVLAGHTAQAFQQRLHSTVCRQLHLATALSRALITAPGRTAARALLTLYPQTMTHIASHTRLRR